MLQKKLKQVTCCITIAFTVQTQAQTEPEMVLIPAACVEIGTLLIGENANPLREVCLDAFEISVHEITFAEYDQFTEDTGRAPRHDLGFGRDTRPVVDVNWFDAVEYASWLNKKTGHHYRLPTDAEWEYAAKADASVGDKYSWGSNYEINYANCQDCGSPWDASMTAPVGSFHPNGFGLHDIHGNVWEWTSDCYYSDGAKTITDPGSGASHCEMGVVRGGSWDVESEKLVFWIRSPYWSAKPTADIGFRLVRTISEEGE